MLGTIIYALVDITFNLLCWLIIKTSKGVSMIYYYYTDDGKKPIEIAPDELEKIKQQIELQTKMIEELKEKNE